MRAGVSNCGRKYVARLEKWCMYNKLNSFGTGCLDRVSFGVKKISGLAKGKEDAFYEERGAAKSN